MKNVGTLHIAVGMVPISAKSTQTRVVGKITDKMHTTDTGHWIWRCDDNFTILYDNDWAP